MLKRASRRNGSCPNSLEQWFCDSNGGVIVGLKTGLYAFEADNGSLQPVLVFDDAHPDDRTNDSRCDRQGRLWFSRMRDYGRAPTGSVYRLNQSLHAFQAISDLSVPNALCFSPEGDRLYFADTAAGALEVFLPGSGKR
jgi:sugar lactone lactonase YvrE